MRLAALRNLARRGLRALLIAHAPELFVRVCAADDRELGDWGEEIAARRLREQGFTILGRQVETPHGEIDIWARDAAGQLVCIEVKTGRIAPLPRPRGCSSSTRAGRPALDRLDLRWRPGVRCDARRIERLRRCARFLSSEKDIRGPKSRCARVDLVEVFWMLAERRARWMHHRDLRRALR